MVIAMRLPQRKPQRLKNYDYSLNGYYFITICTHNKQHLFGKILDGQMLLNEYGKIGEQELMQIPGRFANVSLDKFVVMPNHIHIIMVINYVATAANCQSGPQQSNPAERSRPFPTLPKIVGLYKSGAARRIRALHGEITVWQKSYYDHIIRTDEDYQNIWHYIDTNPLKWENDKYFIPSPP